jgi:sialate O-acetylesterase
MKLKLFVLTNICFALFNKQLSAQTKLPYFFSDSMVLQQLDTVAIWGTDNPKTKIIVKANWGATASTITNNNGLWKLRLKTPAAGGPFIISISGSSKIVYKNVLIGEVWLCSGQSNMEMPVKGNINQPIIGSNETILNSYNPFIRCFTAPRNLSKTNATNIIGAWKHASTTNTGNFSAAAYYFAKKINAILGVPVGIIHTSWGASNIESWMDSATLALHKEVKIPENVSLKDANTTHTMLYKSMLHPFIGYSIKGMLWYQGEGNRERPKEYQQLLTSFINSLRNQWHKPSLPFYFVQIAPHSGLPNNHINGAYLREAQLKVMETVTNTGMVVTLDIGEQFLIHPSQKEPVGNRLAYWALANNYNIEGISYSGPVFNKIEKNKNDTITISFKYANMGLTSFGKPLTDFEIAGADKVFYPANATFTKGKAEWISISSDQVKDPISVRYGFKNWLQGCLYNVQGLPASSFRTDDW